MKNDGSCCKNRNLIDPKIMKQKYEETGMDWEFDAVYQIVCMIASESEA